MSDRDRLIPYDITYMWNLKYDTNELIYETETDSQTSRKDGWLPWGKRLGKGWSWRQGLVDVSFYMQDEQSPTVQHRGLYSISCDKSYGKVYEKECIYV